MAQLNVQYRYICVLDFEATCDNRKQDKINEKKFSPCHEVIEFPSVLLKFDHATKTYTKISEIQNYCKPLYNTELTKFCMGLTGITQNQVYTGIDFIDAFNEHEKWIIDNIDSDPNEVMIITCGKWDLQTMMPMECMRWNINPSSLYRRVINLKDAFKKVYDKDGKKQRYGMVGMLRRTKLTLEGRHHSGIDDCRNIARIVQHLAEKGCRFDESLVTKFDDPNMYRVNKKTKTAITNEKKIFERLHVNSVSKMVGGAHDEPCLVNMSLEDKDSIIE